MEKLLQHPWFISIQAFVTAHPVLWFCLLVVIVLWLVLGWLAKTIPQIDVLRAKVLLPIAKKYRHRKLVKSVMKSDIRGHVNQEILKLKDFLPTGWAGQVDVDWVEQESDTTFSDDKRIVIRVRPVEDQDRNFVNATYHYLRTSFFPKTQAVIPKPHYEASVLHVCRKIAESRSPSTKAVFEDHILEPAIQRHNRIPNHLDDYALIDKRGFFTGTFLRELHLMATDARFTGARNTVTEETSQILTHIKDFITGYDSEDDMPESAWTNNGNVSKYAILLVANPVKAQSGIDQYVNRARSGFNFGIRRLYIFGAGNEQKLAETVITAIENTVEGVRLVERFKTASDYRGEKGGIGAVFELVA